VRATELALRKELALTRLRIARTELALARAEKKPDSLATVSSAVDLASSILEGRSLGKWSRYARFFLRVVHVVLGVQRRV
jgi:hypothetical protein